MRLQLHTAAAGPLLADACWVHLPRHLLPRRYPAATEPSHPAGQPRPLQHRTGPDLLLSPPRLPHPEDLAKWGPGGIALGPAVWASADGGRQYMNQDALVTAPELADSLIRHPAILPAVRRLQGDDTCFEDITLRYMPAHEGAAERSFHRDCAYDDAHPLRLRSLQAMIYLSDVDDSTHCFSLSPEAVADPLEGTFLHRKNVVSPWLAWFYWQFIRCDRVRGSGGAAGALARLRFPRPGGLRAAF